VLAITLAATLIDRAFCGADFGAACAHASQCAGLGSHCIRVDNRTGYCTRSCSDARDCPPGFSCGAHLRSGDSQPESVCMRAAPPP
jgi:hypothetical protein